jgi:hypothetical protein
MTDETARRYAREGDDTGHCGFCGSRQVRQVRGRQRVVHPASCKLVCEHGGRIPILAEPRETP